MPIPLRPKDNRKDTCSNISSECVIWDGPDIPCLNLCNGDSIEKVVYELATDLCKVLDLLELQGIDTSCLFSEACKPKTFEELLQYIINWMCDVNQDIADLEQNQFTCDRLRNCNITFRDCNNNNVTLSLISNDNNNVFSYILNRICDLYSQINQINTDITNINNEINEIWIAINNLGSGISFPSFTPDNCIQTSTINTMTQFIQYVNNIASKLCSLIVGIGFNPNETVFTLPSNNLQCDILGINTTVSNLVQLYNFVPSFVSSLCSYLNTLSGEITNINTQITNINTQISNCNCGCPEINPVINYHPLFLSGAFTYNHIEISYFEIASLPSGWSVTGATIPAFGLVYTDNNIPSNINTTPINYTGSGPYSITLSSANFSSINTTGCPNTMYTMGGQFVPDRNITLHVKMIINLTNSSTGQTCSRSVRISIPLKHCVCGYVENIDFSENISFQRILT